ncbi:uncharacterized protein LOC111697273 [Eurytemora carolleeae]|uniref:uncharacterized protein LOC111697273 n=1 Tax=Eurytemora carolleeae TaxID=1294199 RepID=UPI000C75FBA9|nr:uncharacterized protein LOC111697273 [Eurytemora carolleeae]|eukprot:XP_023322970.1 uncharacterized protein LOC111697273 [Eurytemora affinis]
MNMRYCSVISCENNSTCQDKIFFSFPKKDLRVAWAKFTSQPSSWNPKKWSVICSDHFSPDDLNRASKRLRPGDMSSSNPQSLAVKDHSYATQETTLNRLSAANNDLQQLNNKLRVRNTRLKQKVKSLEDALENVKSQRTKVRVQLSKLILFKKQ